MSVSCWVDAFFSPTGGTAKVAHAAARGSGLPVVSLDLSAPVQSQAVPRDRILAVSVPVFGGRVPPTALERLSALTGEGGCAAAIVVYGNRAYENALAELKAALEERGFRVTAAAAFLAEHSIARSIAAGRPHAADLELAESFGRRAAQKAALDSPAAVRVPGCADGLPPYSAGTLPAAGEACVDCGHCAALCPAGAIPPLQPHRTDSGRCIACMRCVWVCPRSARALPPERVAAITAKLSAIASQPRQPELFL